MDRASILRTYIQALNEQFAKWVSEQAMSEQDQLWIEGAQDYIKHATKLQEDFKDISAGSTALNPHVTVHAAPLGKPSSGPASSSQPPSFLKAGVPATQPAAELKDPFTGYLGPSEAAKPFAAFNFPTGTANTNHVAPFFSAGAAEASAKHANGTEAGPASKSEEEEGEAPADFDPEVKVGEDSELLFKAAAALHVQTPTGDQVKKDWASKGKGTWTLRRPLGEGGSAKPCYMVFTTEAGRVLVNASAYKGLAIQTPGNGRIMMSLAFGEDQAFRIVLINLKVEDEAQKFKKLLEANIPR